MKKKFSIWDFPGSRSIQEMLFICPVCKENITHYDTPPLKR